MILQAMPGHYLTQSAQVANNERRFEKTVTVKIGGNPAAWREITAAEMERLTAIVDVDNIDVAALDRLEELQKKVAENINNSPLSVEDALAKRAHFPKFEDVVGRALTNGYKCQYGDNLYEVIQPHTAQADWTPDTAVSLFKVVEIESEGTTDDVIDWTVGMELEEGKYYRDGGVKYLCIRNSGQPMHFALADLVNAGYVEAVMDETASSQG